MKLMIVDDDAITRALLRQIVSQLPGVEIVEAEDGLDAWNQLIAGVSVDFCLLDVMMPQMDGIQLLRRLRQDDRFKGLKVIICSVIKDSESIKRAVSLNVEDYLLKPFTKESVRQVFQSAVRRSGQPMKQPAATRPKRGGATAKLYEDSLGFIEHADGELAKVRQWLKEDNRLAAWESTGTLLQQAWELSLSEFVHAMENLESAVMTGNKEAAIHALDDAGLAIQTILSQTIGKPALEESKDGAENSFSS
jgi:YesN/AraC family two-component response regulator